MYLQKNFHSLIQISKYATVIGNLESEDHSIQGPLRQKDIHQLTKVKIIIPQVPVIDVDDDDDIYDDDDDFYDDDEFDDDQFDDDEFDDDEFDDD